MLGNREGGNRGCVCWGGWGERRGGTGKGTSMHPCRASEQEQTATPPLRDWAPTPENPGYASSAGRGLEPRHTHRAALGGPVAGAHAQGEALLGHQQVDHAFLHVVGAGRRQHVAQQARRRRAPWPRQQPGQALVQAQPGFTAGHDGRRGLRGELAVVARCRRQAIMRQASDVAAALQRAQHLLQPVHANRRRGSDKLRVPRHLGRRQPEVLLPDCRVEGERGARTPASAVKPPASDHAQAAAAMASDCLKTAQHRVLTPGLRTGSWGVQLGTGHGASCDRDGQMPPTATTPFWPGSHARSSWKPPPSRARRPSTSDHHMPQRSHSLVARHCLQTRSAEITSGVVSPARTLASTSGFDGSGGEGGPAEGVSAQDSGSHEI